MRLERLEIRNITNLRHVVIEGLPPGLIAITGENGSGKTTLLESVIAALYRTMPSRGGELADYATDRDSTIDVRVAVDGVGSFHARVNLDGIRRTTEAVLEHQGHPVSDGKVSTFDAEVRRRFPSLAVMLASAMSAQNKRGNFINKKPKDRKELFADLLALGHLEAMSTTAKTVLSLIDGRRERLLAMREELRRLAKPEALQQFDAAAHHLSAESAGATASRERYDAEIAQLEAESDAMDQIVRDHGVAAERLRTLDRDIASNLQLRAHAAQDGVHLDTMYDRDLALLDQRSVSMAMSASQRTEATVADLDKRIETERSVLRRSDAIRAAVVSLRELDERTQALRTRLDTARAEQVQVTEDRIAIDQRLSLLAQPEHQLTQARANAMLIDTVPFGRRCADAGCQFLHDAIEGQAAIPALEQRLAPKSEWEAEVARLTATLSGHRAVVVALTTELGATTKERTTLQTTAALADKVTVAETRIEELKETRERTLSTLTSRMIEIATEIGDAKADLAERRHGAWALLQTRVLALETEGERLRREHVTVAAEVASTRDGYQAAVGLRQRINAVREKAQQCGERVAALAVELVALATARQAYHDNAARLACQDAAVATLDGERIAWAQLQRALSRDGVPVLEMDAAGPRISELTNTLLMACFGPRFSVELVTQQAKTSGAGMKESFELMVSDNERGGAPREVSDLSGGEQVIVSEALMNAIAIYANQRSPMPIRTCWRDETTGALDPENAERYLQMLRQVVTLGEYHQIIFVTHSAAIAAQADAQIHLADGGAEVLLPPYGVSEAA